MLWLEILLLVNELTCVACLVISCLAIHLAFKGLGTTDEKSSDTVDWYARRLVPVFYVSALTIVYSLKLDDGYMGTTTPMIQGVGHVSMSPSRRIVWPLVVLVLFLACSMIGTHRCTSLVNHSLIYGHTQHTNDHKEGASGQFAEV